VPTVRKGFVKFWCNEEVSLLKEASVKSDKLWKASGKPRNGPVFANRHCSLAACGIVNVSGIVKTLKLFLTQTTYTML